MAGIGKTLKRVSRRIFSRQVGTFLIFLVISTLLWFVTTLNELVQRQIDYRLNIINIPDSATFITQPPTVVTVNVRGRGTDLVRNMMGSQPTLTVDFSKYAFDNRFAITKRALFDMVQSSLGDERQVMDVTPDSIRVSYTLLPPVRIPVKVAVTASTTPNVCLDGAILPAVDSVSIYSITPLGRSMRYVSTVDTHFDDISRTTTESVRISVPDGCRAEPPSIDVTIKVEPVVTEERMVDIELINVPYNKDVVLEEPKVRASFRVPRSQRTKLPEIHVVADYAAVSDSLMQGKIPIMTTQLLPNVFLGADSVSFFIPQP